MAPKLRMAVRDAVRADCAFLVLDGTLIPAYRVAADRPFYSGKHRRHGMNLQVIASPGGEILWVSRALPGTVHDKNVRWIWACWPSWRPRARLSSPIRATRGSAYVKIPYKGKNKPESQKQANKAHAKLRSPGKRANAQLKSWRILRKLRCCFWRAGSSPRPSTYTPELSILRHSTTVDTLSARSS